MFFSAIAFASVLATVRAQLESFTLVSDQNNPNSRCAFVETGKNAGLVGFGDSNGNLASFACSRSTGIVLRGENDTLRMVGKLLSLTRRDDNLYLTTVPQNAPNSLRTKFKLMGNSIQVLPDAFMGVGENQCLHATGVDSLIVVKQCDPFNSREINYALPPRFFRLKAPSGKCAYIHPGNKALGFAATAGQESECDSEESLFLVNPFGRVYIMGSAVNANEDGKLVAMDAVTPPNSLTTFALRLPLKVLYDQFQSYDASVLVDKDSQKCIYDNAGQLQLLSCNTTPSAILTRLSVFTA